MKRARWITVGFVAGVGSSVWARRALRRAAQRVAPPSASDVADRMGRQARAAGHDVAEAWREGRTAMRRREAELRGGLPPAHPESANPAPNGRR